MTKPKIKEQTKPWFGKNKTRLLIWAFLFVSTYFFVIYNWFVVNNYLSALAAVILLFVFGMFLFIDFHKLAKKIRLLSLFVLFILWLGLFFFGEFSFAELFTVLIIDILIFALYLNSKYVHFSPWNYFFAPWYIFSLIFSVWVSVFLIGQYNWLNLSCANINQYTDDVINWVEKSFWISGFHWAPNIWSMSAEELRTYAQNVMWFTNVEIDNIVEQFWGEEKVMDLIKTSIPENLNLDEIDLSDWISWIIWDPWIVSNTVISGLTSIDADDFAVLWTVSDRINEIKDQTQSIYQDISKNKSFLSLFYCQKLLESMDGIANWIWIATVIIFTFIFWWVFRLVMAIFSTLSYLLFCLLKLLWFYNVVKVKREVKDIE